MSATAALLRGRAKAESLMLDTCTITRVTGEATDSETGDTTPTTSTVYSGACKVQRGGATSGNPRELGEASIQLMSLELHLPTSATGVQVDDVAIITASTLDPDLVNRRLTLRSTSHKTFLTARRFQVEEVGS